MTDSTCVETNAVRPQGEVDLTDDQIQQLLLEAEARLRAPELTSSESLALNVSAGKDQSESNASSIPALSLDPSLKAYVHQKDDVAMVDPSRMINPLHKNMSNLLRPVEGTLSKGSRSKDRATAGSDWFDLPKTELTSELKRDLQLLRMRSVLDPKRHYKKENGKSKLPEFSQLGTVVEGPTEFFSARIAKKDRKKTFVDETLAIERESRRFESKYRDIQANKQSGKKSFYKSLRAKRSRRSK